MRLINLGSGNDNKSGYINIDVSPNVGADLVLDVTKEPFPYTTDSIDGIHAIDFFEHILYPVPVLNECWRVLKKDCNIYIEVPMAGTNDYYKDPTHVRPFVPETFRYFSDYAKGYPALDCKPWIIVKEVDAPNRIYITMTPDKS